MMKNLMLISLLFLFIVLSCGSSSPGAQNDLPAGFIPPDDPGLAVFRTAVFTVDWQLITRDQIDWETAAHVPSIQVTYDENDRITETVGLWMGRPSDNVIVARYSPMLRINYEEGVETITFHWSDGEPCGEIGFWGFRITRSDDGNISVMEFLAEDGSILVDRSGIAYRQIEYSGDGWYLETTHDETGAQVPIMGSDVYAIRQQLNSQMNQIATESTDSLGELISVFGEVYRIERDFDAAGHLIEVKRYGSDGQNIEGPGNPAWETYEVSPSGLTTGFALLAPDGSSSVNQYGVHSNVIEYDQYGRIVFTAGFGTSGDPVTVGGVWANTIEYDDDNLQTTAQTLDQNRELVNLNGFSTVVTEKDSVGNTITISFYDCSGEPARDAIEVHRYRFIYTSHCKLLERQVWDSSNEPDTSSMGFHSERNLFDDKGTFLRTEYHDTDGQLLNY